jgi:hypothetical protein
VIGVGELEAIQFKVMSAKCEHGFRNWPCVPKLYIAISSSYQLFGKRKTEISRIKEKEKKGSENKDISTKRRNEMPETMIEEFVLINTAALIVFKSLPSYQSNRYKKGYGHARYRQKKNNYLVEMGFLHLPQRFESGVIPAHESAWDTTGQEILALTRELNSPKPI